METIKKVSRGLYSVERLLTVVTFASMIFIMFIQVFFRYVIHASLSWSEEIMRFLFIFTSYCGAACCTYEHKHVVIDFLGTIVKKLYKDDESRQEMVYAAFDVIVGIVCTGFFTYIAWVMIRYAMSLKAMNALSSAIAMPLDWMGNAVAASFIACAVQYFFEIFIAIDQFQKLKKGRG